MFDRLTQKQKLALIGFVLGVATVIAIATGMSL